MTIGELARADRDDRPQHPRPPDARPAAAAGGPRPHRLLQRGARRADRADPRNAGRGAQPGGDPARAREQRRLLARRSSTSPAPCAPRSRTRRRRSSTPTSWPQLWGATRLDPKLLRRGEKLGILRALPDGKIEVISPRLQRAGGRAGRARRQPRGRARRPPRSCAATPTASPAPSSTSSSRRSGSRSTGPAAPRRTGRRCARRSTGCARSPPTRCWRCSRSRWARRPRRRASAPCELSRQTGKKRKKPADDAWLGRRIGWAMSGSSRNRVDGGGRASPRRR